MNSKLNFITLFFLCTLTLIAEPEIYSQLCDLNKQWQNIKPTQEMLEKRKFLSDQELITYHLQEVEKQLSQTNVDHLSPIAQHRRKEGLAVLRQYWKRGLYPKNNKFSYRIPFFIDDENTACAVGYIMQGTENETLADFIARTQNNAYVKEMTSDRIFEWAANYGFTIDELAWIQPTYGSCNRHYRPDFGYNIEIAKPTCGNSNGSIVFSNDINDRITSYQWEHGANDLKLYNLPAGIYKIKGTMIFFSYDECPFEYTVKLENENSPDLTVNRIAYETCTGLKDGVAEVIVNNADGQYNIQWFNGETTEISSNQAAGLSYVSVTDEANCTAIGQVWMYTSSELKPVVNVSHTLCGSNTGEIEIKINNEEKYTFNWAVGNALSKRTNLSPGNYSVKISDNEGCFVEKNITVYDDCDKKIICNDDYIDVYKGSESFIFQFENDSIPPNAKIDFVYRHEIENGIIYPNDYLAYAFITNEFTKLVYSPSDTTYTGTDSFKYRVCTDSGYCDTATVYLNIVDYPTVRVVNRESQDMVIFPGEGVRLYPLGAASYTVTPETNVTEFYNYFKATPTETTTYTFTGTTNDGLTDTYDVTVEVIGDTVLPGIEAINNGININADAFNNLIYINGQLQNYNISVQNVANNDIFHRPTPNNTSAINLQDLDDGLYYLIIQHKDYSNVISQTIISK